MTDLPPLRDVIARHGLDARKSLGQHFLLDAGLIDRIVRQAGALDGRHVVEVGPGPGGLTRALLAGAAADVLAVELDRRAIAALAELGAAFPGRLRVLEADAVRLDLAALVPAPRVLAANLPYNVATPLAGRLAAPGGGMGADDADVPAGGRGADLCGAGHAGLRAAERAGAAGPARFRCCCACRRAPSRRRRRCGPPWWGCARFPRSRRLTCWPRWSG